LVGGIRLLQPVSKWKQANQERKKSMKNMTRKGLSIGAGLALIGSAFVATPALAAPTSLTLTPAMGSTFQSVLGATFNLKLLAPGNAGETVDYHISGATAANITVKTGAGTTSAPTTALPTIGTSASAVAISNNEKTSYVTGDLLEAGKYIYLSIALDATNVTDTTSIVVTPFVDGTVLANHKPDAGEVAGSPVTIVFTDGADLSASIDLVAGDLAASSNTTAYVTVPGVNMADTVGGVTDVEFSKNGAAYASGTDAGYDVTEGAYSFTQSYNLAATDVVSAKATVGASTTAVGTTTASAVSGEVASLGALAVTPGNYYVASSAGSTADAVRVGAGSVSVTTDVTAAGTYEAAGQTVTFTVTETSVNSLSGSVSAGGKTLSNAKVATVEKITVDVVADADGTATLDLTYSGLKAGDLFTVKADADGAAAVVSQVTKAFTVVPSASYRLIATDVFGADASDTVAVVSVVKQAATSVNYKLVDEFGLTPVGTYRANWSLAAGGSGAVQTGQVSFVNGMATVSFTNNSDAAAARNLTMDVEVLASGSYGDVTYPAAEPTVVVDVLAAAVSAARVTATNSVISTAKATNVTTALASGDKRVAPSASTFIAVATDSISGSVYTASNALVSGAKVTVSAPGVLFRSSADEVYSLNSITVTANNDGGYKVFYASNSTATTTFTVTSGAASKTTTTKFNPALENSGAVVTITAPNSVTPGSTLQATATVVDKFGNPVDTDQTGLVTTQSFLFSAVSVGIQVGSDPTDTDAAGQAKLGYFIGQNDTGTIVLTATYDVDGDATTVADRFTVTKSVVIGTAGNTGALATWTSNQNDGTVKMYAKNVVGAGKVQFMLNGVEIAWVRAASTADSKLRLAGAEGAAYLVRTVDLVEGKKNILEIYVDGVRTTRTAYTY
jgi:hypothetical protein